MKSIIEDIKTLGLFKTIKFIWQRAFRGYDDTFYWGMDDYLTYYFVPAIQQFCEHRLKEYNDERFLKVYKTMLEKIVAFENMEYEDFYKEPNANSEMWSYFGNNIGYFWD